MTAHRKNVVRKARRRSPQSEGEARHLDHAALEALGRKTYLSPQEAAIYLSRFTVLDAKQPDADARLRRATRAVYEWARVHKIPSARMGSSLLFLRRDLDESIQTKNAESVSHARAS